MTAIAIMAVVMSTASSALRLAHYATARVRGGPLREWWPWLAPPAATLGVMLVAYKM